MRGKRSDELTELENHVLSIIWRLQPATAYQVRRSFSQSSHASRTLSQGSIYPIVARLKDRELVSAVSTGQRKKTSQLTCTPAGEAAARDWVFDFSNSCPHDPLRDRFFALPALSAHDRKLWVRQAKDAILESLASIEQAAQDSVGTHFELSCDIARLAALAQIRWLERVEAKLGLLSAEDEPAG